jgi:dihydropteroate synthase
MSLSASLAGVAVGAGQPVRIVGAVNVSPESFYAGSVRTDDAALAAQARQMVAEGADLIDLGAMSTAPYLETRIEEAEEQRRMEWAVGVVAQAVDVPISADTRRASVAAVALAAGARVVNDTSGLRTDPQMAAVAAQADGVILMASEEGPFDQAPVEVSLGLLRRSLALAADAGIAVERIVLDPGIGFFRRGGVPWDEFDLELIRELEAFHALGRPLLVGISRKSFIGKLTGRDAADRLWGSLAAAAVAVVNGAGAVRTHDVAATRDAVRVAERLRSAGAGCAR